MYNPIETLKYFYHSKDRELHDESYSYYRPYDIFFIHFFGLHSA